MYIYIFILRSIMLQDTILTLLRRIYITKIDVKPVVLQIIQGLEVV